MRSPSRAVVLASFVLVVAACAPAMRSSIAGPPSPSQMAELWNEPADLGNKDLANGVGGAGAAPDPHAVYAFEQNKSGGFSQKMEVRDPSGEKWDVKLGPEAGPEVVSSRVVWAMGYHQVPSYYLPTWTLEQAGKRRDLGPARFRPRLRGLEKEADWSWHHNPFVDTQPFRGLVVLMMVLNSTDLKDENNGLYDLKKESEGARRWYVVKDLGATLGETGRQSPRRGDPDLYTQHGFVTGVRGSRVLFDFEGRHQELLSVVHPEDVRWMCGYLARLSDVQWRQMFRAGGYNDDQIEKFVTKLHQKISQGTSLAGAGGV